ncbi:hypothetical protein AB0L04_00975 [Streptomyces glaucescens]|uniref:hypothetical protein n=1 Tax=Streptomyces glaucescens TaxID=1907 RepID=UPI00344EABE3
MADVAPAAATRPAADPTTENAHSAQDAQGARDAEGGGPPSGPVANPATETPEVPQATGRRRQFAAVLGEFRRTAVLVPLGDAPGPDGERGLLTADFNGVRFILAFSDEQALARYAQARGEYAREWTYQRILGARLLDVAVPAAGVPCGVALDCADGPDGMVFPPVRGIVPDEVAVDAERVAEDRTAEEGTA